MVKQIKTDKQLARELKEQRKRNNEERLMIERERKNKSRLPVFKNRNVDYSKWITVMVDRKTAILVPPGSNIKAAKKKHLETIERQKKKLSDDKPKAIVRTEKVCTRCKDEKPIDDFSKNRQCPDGHTTICAACTSAVNKAKEFNKRF